MGKESQVLGSLLPDYRIAMDAQAFDNAIRSQGIPLVHYRAMRCPGGLVDVNDIRRPHEDHADCSGGFLYKKVGCLTGLATSNSTDYKHNDIGLLNGSTIQMTFPRYYDDPKETVVYVLPYDRFYLNDPDNQILTAEWQLVQAHETGSDRLRFPAIRVQHIVDANLVEYGCDAYTLDSGRINWKAGLGPSPGTIYTIWYQYRPYWYVSQLIHEIRVAGTRDYVTGVAKIARFPFAAHLTRENIHRSEENDGGVATERTQPGPADGGFGAR